MLRLKSSSNFYNFSSTKKSNDFKNINNISNVSFAFKNRPFSSLKDFPKDSISNIPPNIAEKIGVNLHMQKDHPIQIIKSKIHGYFDKGLHGYKLFDNLSPIVTTQACFDDMLVPQDHESRLPANTYYVNKDHVLRAHTSAHQTQFIREGHEAFLVAGDVYRRDEIDASHYPVFHQMEGVRIFESQLKSLRYLSRRCCAYLSSEQDQVKMIEGDLKTTLEGMVRTLFGQVNVRWVDAYFPFTLPSYEMEIHFNNQWLEVLGCGVIQQRIMDNTLGAGGKTPKKGWAFGLGLERLAMVLFDIPDIRLFWSKDPRFIEQFTGASTAPTLPKFKPYSKYPPCIKDITFWLPTGYHENNFFEMVRGTAGDMVETVKIIDKFKHPKTGRESHCYRINYRSNDRNLTNEEINGILCDHDLFTVSRDSRESQKRRCRTTQSGVALNTFRHCTMCTLKIEIIASKNRSDYDSQPSDFA